MSNFPTKTFLISGVSSGFGRAFARAALADGHRVIGTVRNEEAARAFQSLDAAGRCRAGVPYGHDLDTPRPRLENLYREKGPRHAAGPKTERWTQSRRRD